MNKNIKELEKEYAAGKVDVIANMTDKELEKHIMALAKNSYVSYLNDDETEYNSILKTLDLITDEYNREAYFSCNAEDDLSNFIDYCMLSSINSLLNDLMERSFKLRMPKPVAINDDGTTESLAERTDKDKTYIKDFILRTLKHTDNIRTLIRPDAKMEDVDNAMESLERIFLPEVVAALKEIMEG